MRYLLLIVAIHFIVGVKAQKNHSLGVGYFGETLTYPGVVFEYEIEFIQSAKVSLLSKSGIGYYNHPRNHRAVFVDHQIGLRRNVGKRWFVEHSLGIGLMLPMLNAPVYKVNDKGEIEETSKIMNLDFIPSFSMGLGYDFNKTENRDAVWIRPKMFWQYPYNTLALPHVAIQIGFTHTIKTK